MSQLEHEIPHLKASVLEMMEMVRKQVERVKNSLLLNDSDLAYEAIASEKRINAFELKIDIDCENIMARFNPVAVDLRFLMTSYKINSSLERIADNAENIAKSLLNLNKNLDVTILDTLRLKEMFEFVFIMMDNIYQAYQSNDTSLARKLFKQDKKIDAIYKESLDKVELLIRENIDSTRDLLILFSVIRKIERMGDLIKNISEELIYNIEATVLKHAKKKKKLLPEDLEEEV